MRRTLTLKQLTHIVTACCRHFACRAFEGFSAGGLDQLPLAERTLPGREGGVTPGQSPGPLGGAFHTAPAAGCRL